MKFRFSPFRWLMKPIIWLVKPVIWIAKLLFWPIIKLQPMKKLSKPLRIVYQAILSRIKSSIRMQLILIFIICLFMSIMIGTVTYGILEGYTRRAYIEYTLGKYEIDETARDIAKRLTDDPFSQLYDENIQEIIDDAVAGRNFKAMITDVKGRVLYKSVNATEAEIDLYDLIKNTNDVKSGPKINEATMEYSSFYPSEVNGMKVYVISTGVPKANIVYQKSGNGGVMLAAIATYIGVFVISFHILTKKKMKYVEEIAAGLQIISTGNLDFRVASKGSDELASLAGNINSMAGELKSRIEEERRAERTKNELITNISHDLRTPLTSIMGYLKLVSDKKYQDSRQLEDFINIAYGKSEKLKTLIDDLFEYTKISNEGVTLNMTDVSINELLEQLVEELIPASEENQLEFVKEIPHEKIIAGVDADLTARVFENLLMNAIRYSYKPGKIVIKLSRQKSKAIICIENNGDPIPSEELPNLFNRFYRLEKSRSAGMGGSGLGLAIVKSIVDLHHGDIWVECEGNIIRVFVGLPL